MRIPYAWSLGSLTFAREPLARLSCNESQTLLQCTMGKDSRLVWPKLNNCLGMLTAHWKIPLQARSLLRGPIVWTCKTWKKSCFPPLRWSRHWLTTSSPNVVLLTPPVTPSLESQRAFLHPFSRRLLGPVNQST